MTIKQNQDFWQEYQNYLEEEYSVKPYHPSPEEMAETLEIERQDRIAHTVRHLNTPLENYELKIAKIAEFECKTPAQWRQAEANDIRINALGAMKYRSAGECLEISQDKLQRAYANEKRIINEIQRYKSQIQTYEQTIQELSNTGYKNKLRSAKNKLKHARGCIIVFECSLAKQNIKTQRYYDKVMKWTGVNEKLKLSHINQTIREEKAGFGNAYGYNPKAQSRDTAEIMFQD